jgi:RHS repeat-associated protein
VNYDYNSAGWLGSILGYVTFGYNSRGQRINEWYANGVTTTFYYHPLNFRALNRTTSAPGVPLQNLSYTHDEVGNITQITDTLWTGSRTFGYDDLKRLTSASGTFGPAGPGGLPTAASQTYQFDAIGNITQASGVVYSYSDPLHPSAVTALSIGSTFTYDANGNMESGAGRSSTWDNDNRLIATTIQGGNSATFAYDYKGWRVRKTTASGVTRYPFSTYEIDPTGTITKFIFVGTERIAAKKSSGTTLSYHNDHLGSVNVVTDGSGAKVQLVEYEPWGMVSRLEGTADPTRRFNGRELDDPEIGLLYYGGRYYSAALRRFISPDRLVENPGNPQSLNRYSYVENDPVNHTDPSGFKKKKSWFSRFIDSLFDGPPLVVALKVVGVVAVVAITLFAAPQQPIATATEKPDAGQGPPSSGGGGAPPLHQLPPIGLGYYSYEPSSNQYGQQSLIEIIQAAGILWSIKHFTRPFGVGDLSLATGGTMPGHPSGHTLGQEVDIRPMRNDNLQVPGTTWQSPGYSQSLTQELVNVFRGFTKVSYIYFNDPNISGVTWYAGHENHLHIGITP